MGKIDDATKEYLDDPKVFSDIVNTYVYDGEQVISPENLEELDSAVVFSIRGQDGAQLLKQKIRDKYQRICVKTDGETAYVIIGIEGQATVNHAMPVKCMCYDAGEYDKQVKKIEKIHIEMQDLKGRTRGEFLWKFSRKDYLIPVITVVINLSDEPWNGPLSLHDMFRIKNKKILSMVENYRIHLIDPHTMRNEDIEKFQTDLREVMLFIKYQKDKKKLREIAEANPRFKHIKRGARKMIEVCAKWKFKVEKDEQEETDMCKALLDIKEEGREEGRDANLVENLKSIMESFNVTVERALEVLKVPVDKYDYYRKLVC